MSSQPWGTWTLRIPERGKCSCQPWKIRGDKYSIPCHAIDFQPKRRLTTCVLTREYRLLNNSNKCPSLTLAELPPWPLRSCCWGRGQRTPWPPPGPLLEKSTHFPAKSTIKKFILPSGMMSSPLFSLLASLYKKGFFKKSTCFLWEIDIYLVLICFGSLGLNFLESFLECCCCCCCCCCGGGGAITWSSRASSNTWKRIAHCL